MWDERYASDEFIYGTEPNDFLAEHASLLADPVLSLAESEGRNAVFMASLGHRVLGVDSSAVGLAKAHQLAASSGYLWCRGVNLCALAQPHAQAVAPTGRSGTKARWRHGAGGLQQSSD